MVTMEAKRPRALGTGLAFAALVLLLPGFGARVAAQAVPDTARAPVWSWDAADPRIGLAAGWTDAASAIRNLRLVASVDRPEAFRPPSRDVMDFDNTDLAFTERYLFQGNYHGFQAWEISEPARPELVVSVVCPGGQGDVSVYEHLLFMSVEETRGRLDCGVEGVQEAVSEQRMRGVRIFDVSDIRNPRQLATVQTCRGSHTHTLVTHPDDLERVFVYVSGTGRVRPAEELEGCSGLSPEDDPNTALFRIEVIEVPLGGPERARVVSMPRIFADAETGDISGLYPGGDHGPGTQRSSETNQCHDITAFPEIGLAAGACSGNGILLDISDPANPRRVDEVLDPNFAYWHSATFNNDGTRVVFTDEWGGGSAPRCRPSDPPEWGANAIFRVTGRGMELAGYYKLPVPQTETENCVAHNGSLIPVPGRDIMVQAWYQGGISVFDFTDPERPFEIAFFDRGPLSETELYPGGYWSAYWHNGYIYGAEITRGIDVLELMPSEHLTRDEIDAARSVRLTEFNPQLQPRYRWASTFALAGAYVDQLERSGVIAGERIRALRAGFEAARALPEGVRRSRALDELAEEANGMAREAAPGHTPAGALAATLRDLAGAR